MSMLLTPRWTALRTHKTQEALWLSPHRFNVNPAGRRSGKTELAKRKVVLKALEGTEFRDPRFFVAAPTRDQAKRIYWKDLKAMVPDWIKRGNPSETELIIPLLNGAEIHVLGMDKPERIEGSPWDGGILDEYGNMKGHAWGEHVRPALSDRRGWCDFIGVPEGRNHYYDLDKAAKALMLENGEKSDWGSYHWISADILPQEEIEAAKRDLDQLTYEQEYEANFVTFQGRAYYPYMDADHARILFDQYRERAPLIFCFDFNVDPGVAAVAQEMELPNGEYGTGWIGEVYIERNSNTPAVCRKLIQDWGHHKGIIRCYGDSTGGARGTAQTEGSDWDLIKKIFRRGFGNRVAYKVPANPSERARINAMNSRLKSVDGTIKMMVDPKRCPHLSRDFEGVSLLVGGSGEIDKKKNPNLSHLTDAAGYYIHAEFPVKKRGTRILKPTYAAA